MWSDVLTYHPRLSILRVCSLIEYWLARYCLIKHISCLHATCILRLGNLYWIQPVQGLVQWYNMVSEICIRLAEELTRNLYTWYCVYLAYRHRSYIDLAYQFFYHLLTIRHHASTWMRIATVHASQQLRLFFEFGYSVYRPISIYIPWLTIISPVANSA